MAAGSPTEQDVGLESRKWGIFKHYAKKPTKEKKNPSGWFVGQNVNDNTPSTNYEDCNEACARYTKDIQDKGFKGSLVCNEEAISVMSSIVDDAGMSDALLARSSFSDPFPNEDISIVADDRTNIMNLGTVSPYFFTPVGSPMTQARYVQPGFAGPAGRADTTCTNAFTNGDVAVNRYCFCIYEK